MTPCASARSHRPTVVGGADIGEVTETLGPSDLPALRFAPATGFEGTAIFSYRPIDTLGWSGDDVEVRVDVATAADANRPPVARPDAVRVRRDVVDVGYRCSSTTSIPTVTT